MTAKSDARRPAREVIVAVLANMRQNLEPLRYSTLAPSRYLVYLHPAEYARLEGIVPILQEQTVRALTEELTTLNRRTAFERYTGGLLGRPSAPVQSAGRDWQVEFFPDPDGELAEGDILIDSELVLTAAPELGAGERTRRVTTHHAGEHTSLRERPGRSSATDPSSREDRLSGQCRRPLVRRREGLGDYRTRWYHLSRRHQVASTVDVSREHARIRRDPSTGTFYLIDLSSLGTTLNGRHIPRGYDEVEGSKRENGAETALPDQARIGLAEMVYLTLHGASAMTTLLAGALLAARGAGRHRRCCSCGCRVRQT